MIVHEVDLWNRALARIGEVRIVLEAAKTITNATAANPVAITCTAHGYSDGDLVLITGIGGMTEINNRVFEVDSTGANSFTLLREDGTAYTAYTTGGSAQKLPANKQARECWGAWLKARDQVIRSHPWNSTTRRTRLARLAAAKTITGATAANPIVVTSAAHGYSAGDLVLIDGIAGMIEINDRYFTVANPATNTFELSGENGTTYTAYSSGGTARKAMTPLKPDYGYDCRYTLPVDCERVFGPLDETEDWEVEGREYLTDQGPTVPIRYASRLVAVSDWDGELVRVMVARLASDIVEALTQSPKKRELLLQEFEIALRDARATDSKEQSPPELSEDDWILARY